MAVWDKKDRTEEVLKTYLGKCIGDEKESMILVKVSGSTLYIESSKHLNNIVSGCDRCKFLDDINKLTRIGAQEFIIKNNGNFHFTIADISDFDGLGCSLKFRGNVEVNLIRIKKEIHLRNMNFRAEQLIFLPRQSTSKSDISFMLHNSNISAISININTHPLHIIPDEDSSVQCGYYNFATATPHKEHNNIRKIFDLPGGDIYTKEDFLRVANLKFAPSHDYCISAESTGEKYEFYKSTSFWILKRKKYREPIPESMCTLCPL